MKLIYCSDLHGHKTLYRQLLALSESENADCIAIGGDLLPHEQSFDESMTLQRGFIESYLKPVFSEFRQAHPATEVYVMMGNDDWAANMYLLEEMEESGIVKLLHERVHILEGGICLAGYGFVPPTPFRIKDWEKLDTSAQELRAGQSAAFISTRDGLRRVDFKEWLRDRSTIREDLVRLSKMSDPKSTIYVMHSPPHGTGLDRLHDGTPVGSNAVREFVIEHRPYLTLHGHIHESPAVTGRHMEQIGGTISVNPGASAQRLRAVVFELSDARGTLRLVETESSNHTG